MSEEHSRGRLNWPSQWHAWLRIAMTQMHLLTSQSSVYMWTVMLNEAKTAPSSSIWPHLSYGLVRSKREYYH